MLLVWSGEAYGRRRGGGACVRCAVGGIVSGGMEEVCERGGVNGEGVRVEDGCALLGSLRAFCRDRDMRSRCPSGGRIALWIWISG